MTLNELIYEQEGKYYYEARGLNAPKDSLVLFQIHKKLVASAIFVEDINEDSNEFYHFIIETFRTYRLYSTIQANSLQN